MSNLFVKYTNSFQQNIHTNGLTLSSTTLDNIQYDLVSYNNTNYITIKENGAESVVLADYVYSVSLKSKEENLNIVNNLNLSGYEAYLPFPDTCHYIIYVLLPKTNSMSEILISITTLNILVNNDSIKFSFDGISEENLIPNDTLYSQQWYLPLVQAPSAWDITTGSNNVTVAVLDTGVASSNVSLSADIRPKLIPGASFITEEPTTFDGRGHGTQCAHIIGAVTNNSSSMSGVSWLCRIAPVKVLSSGGTGTWSALAAGILWAADNNCDVLSMSLGGSTNLATDPSLITAIDYAIGRNCVLVVAAGNSGPSGNNPPANCNPVISVGAVTSNGSTSSFSSFQSGTVGGRSSNQMTLCAPGSSVLSIDQNDSVANVNGTSFACPIVAGCCALLKSINKNLTHAQIKDILQRSAGNGTNTYENNFRGFGLLNIRRALELAGPVVTPTPTITPGLTRTPTPTPTLTNTPTASSIPANGSILLNGDFELPSSLSGVCNGIGIDSRQGFLAAPPWYIFNNCNIQSFRYCDNNVAHNRYVAMGWTANLGYIEQTMSTVPGREYECRFSMGCSPGYNSFGFSTRTVRAIVHEGTSNIPPSWSWGTTIFDSNFSINNVVTGNTYNSLGWQNKSFKFTAISNTTTLRFQVPVSAECTVAIDDVLIIPSIASITPTPTPTPTSTNIIISPTSTAPPIPTRTPNPTGCDNKVITVCIPGNILRSDPNASQICFRVGGTSCCTVDTQPPTILYSTPVCLPIPPVPPPPPPPPPEPCVPSVVNAPLTMEIAYESTLSPGSISCGQGSHICNRTIFDVMVNGTNIGTANLNNANDGGSRSSRVGIPDNLITGDSFTFELRCSTGGCHWGVAIVRIFDRDNNMTYQSCLANDEVFVIRRCPVTPTISSSQTPTPTPTVTSTNSSTPTPTPTQTPNPFSISWNTSYSGTLNGDPWIISNNNKKIRYNVEDSQNCGGSNNNIQTGIAIATINTSSNSVNMNIDFDGLGEAQASEFELIRFYLNDNLIASANAPGGGLRCAMGPVVKDPPNIPTIVLSPNTQYQFKIDFTTSDAQFHVGAFYEVSLVFN